MNGHDRYDNESSAGSGFVMGLLTGTVLGAGLGMLFAPKSGSELRGQLSEQANQLANSAQQGYRKATDTATHWAEKGREVADKGRDVYDKVSDKTREAVNRGTEEAQRYVRDVASATSTPRT